MIDKYNAPDGYTAIKEQGYLDCAGCDFVDDGSNCKLQERDFPSCSSKVREDRINVIFVENTSSLFATLKK